MTSPKKETLKPDRIQQEVKSSNRKELSMEESPQMKI